MEETQQEATQDQSESQVSWTYAPEMKLLRDQWIEQGKPNIPATMLPSEILEKFGIESQTIGPEVFFSNEVQNMMTLLFLNGELPLEPQVLPLGLLEEDMPGQNSVVSELLGIPPESKGLSALQEHLATHLGLDSKEDLSEEMLDRVMQLHQRILSADEEFSRLDLNDRESPELEIGGSSTIQWPSEHTEDQAIEALDSLSLKNQEHLREFGETLYDRPALLKALRDMSNEQAFATLELLRAIDSEGTNSTRNPTLPPEVENALLQQVDRGYIEQLNRKPPTTRFKQRVERNRAKNGFDSFVDKLFGQEIVALDSEQGIEISSGLSPVPTQFVLPKSQNSVMKNSDMTHRFYSDTVFGGSVLIVEQELDGFGVIHSNLTIASNEGLVIPCRYGDDVWTTNLYAFNGTTAFRIYADGKLEGRELQEFIRFSRELVEYDME